MSASPAIPSIPVPIPFDARRIARGYYWRGWGVTELAAEMGLNASTVQSWKERDKWDDDPVIRKVEESIEMRLNQLIFKEKKSGQDFKEIDLLGRQIERIPNRMGMKAISTKRSPTVMRDRKSASPKT
jgi:uncharacterized protein YjcR